MSRTDWVRVLCACVAMAGLAGCPRVAYVTAYNNTGVEVTVGEDGGSGTVVPPGGEARFRFTGHAIVVESGLGRWWYPRQIPGDGASGPFFDGTLRLQVEPDGALYALAPGEPAPSARLRPQPRGFPLRPSVGTDGER